jgi:excisionase family DNA binding protein
MTNDSAWLSISEAAKHLGVHISTLRRWSDQGLIAYVRTPGGKRKFQKEALVAFVDQYRSPVTESNALTVFQDQAISRTRDELHSLGVYQTPWYIQMTEEQRLLMRSSGSRLVALMLHYSASSDTSEVFMEEARRITREYGRVCRMLGVDLTHCVQTFLLFRQPILSAIHETGALSSKNDQQSFQLFEKLNRFLDETLVAMIDEYQHFQEG